MNKDIKKLQLELTRRALREDDLQAEVDEARSHHDTHHETQRSNGLLVERLQQELELEREGRRLDKLALEAEVERLRADRNGNADGRIKAEREVERLRKLHRETLDKSIAKDMEIDRLQRELEGLRAERADFTLTSAKSINEIRRLRTDAGHLRALLWSTEYELLRFKGRDARDVYDQDAELQRHINANLPPLAEEKE